MNATEAGGATPSPEDHQQVTLTAASEVQHDSNHEHIDSVERAEEHDNVRALEQILHHNGMSERFLDSEADTDASLPTAHLSKKRKRAASPPWQFPTAEQTTIKTVDGRRSSARVNTSVNNTPGLSESESHSHRNSRAASSRLPSPPWRSFTADGPTSLQVDGVRKSGRVNKDLAAPKRISPRSKKQTDKMMDMTAIKAKNSQRSAREQPSGRKRAHSKTNGQKIDELNAQIAELRSSREHQRKHSGEAEIVVAHSHKSPDSARKHHDLDKPNASRSTPRIKLRFNSSRHQINPPHPSAAFPLQSHPPDPSVWQLIDEYELKEMQQPYTENERGPPSREEFERRAIKVAENEAEMRRKIVKAGKPGGILSAEMCSIHNFIAPQEEPPKQYGHGDHLFAHAMRFRALQIEEEKKHKTNAKKVAIAAQEYWRKKRGPTVEDIMAEQYKTYLEIYKQVVIDIKDRWALVRRHVEDGRRAEYEAAEEVKRQQRLRRTLKESERMIAQQRGELDVSDNELDDDNDDDDDDDNETSDDDDSDENMSDDTSDDDLPDSENDVMNDETLKAYIEQRAVDPPDRPSDLAELLDSNSAAGLEDEDHEMLDADDGAVLAEEAHDRLEQSDVHAAHSKIALMSEGSQQEQDNLPQEVGVTDRVPQTRTSVAPLSPKSDQGLSDDESVNMDSEDYDSDEDMDSTDEGSDSGQSASSEDAAPRSGLLGFFSKSDLRAQGLPTPVTSAEGEHVDERADQMEPLEAQPADHDEEADKLTLTKTHVSSLQIPSRPDTPSSQSVSESTGKQLVAVPALLRGTLRSYQHAGLDWLASLYRNGTNGILADEMGLGKTIQTISMFAHAAEVYNVWNPHLVIVPTSVILNWVMEFQKFLPGFRVLAYYGTADERKIKRHGWTNDPHLDDRDKRGYNVIVTSYNIALKDINALRNVQWHYLVLDEAHSIRNFNSQRFQFLIRLKTRARLLLTGTPLQNSLTELWALLTFLTAGREDGEAAHGGLEEFLARWKDPVNEIFEKGVQSLSEEASRVVSQLHTSLRPFMLRRLKADVEKDLPKKIEYTVPCKLSKRQRQLYQDYMGLSDTRAKLTQGNVISAGRILLNLRRVCNHPDLFDPRPIQTSYALEKSPLESYNAKEKLVRHLLGAREAVPAKLNIAGLETERKYRKARGKQLSGVKEMRQQVIMLEQNMPMGELDTTTIAGCQALIRVQKRQRYLQQLKDSIAYTEDFFATRPVYGSDLRELVTVRATRSSFGCQVIGRLQISTLDSTFSPLALAQSQAKVDKIVSQSTLLQRSIQTPKHRAETLHDTIVRFAFCTPEVVAPVLEYNISDRAQKLLRAGGFYPDDVDAAHEARIRTSIVFPDSRLLVYDAGKLQRLTLLLRELQVKGSRSLIFTQMAGMLDVLEQFLSLMNLPYLRLDGSTSVERRALYAAEFNRPDSKYQCMILSSRAGGVGLNLTGASSVIFYDLDWNPQMDRQCMDRAHRIGQVRDVEVYKLVSEKTVEENILRRANQKSLLDQTVIQEGHFTTDYDRPRDDNPPEDDIAAAVDRIYAGGDKAFTKTIESIEDQEDVQAAQQARKEELQDDEDFGEQSSEAQSLQQVPAIPEGIEYDINGHIDSFMIKFEQWSVQNVPYVPPATTVSRDRARRRRRHR